MRRTDLPGYL